MELLRISARVLAALHSGMIEGLSCLDCGEETQETLNCDGTQPVDAEATSVFSEPELELDLPTCPLLMLSEECMSYYDEFLFFKHLNKFQYDYETVPNRMWLWMKDYLHYLDKFSALKIKEDREAAKSGSSSEENMSSLKSQFLNKSQKK